MRFWVPLVLAGVSWIGAGCNPGKEARNKECHEFADWSNKTGIPLATAVPENEKTPATNDGKAAMYKKLAEGARKAAAASIPFKDPHVRDLATRHLAVFEEVAGALDRQADAWQRGDRAAADKALKEELAAKGKHQTISNEWMKGCRL
jgi:hypothetical protein